MNVILLRTGYQPDGICKHGYFSLEMLRTFRHASVSGDKTTHFDAIQQIEIGKTEE